jgi:hypothetical protein
MDEQVKGVLNYFDCSNKNNPEFGETKSITIAYSQQTVEFNVVPANYSKECRNKSLFL